MSSSPLKKPTICFATPPFHRQSAERIQYLQSLHWSFSPTSLLIDSVGATPDEILDQLYANRGRINVFHYAGDDAQFNLLYEASKNHLVGDLYTFFGQEKELRLLVLVGCASMQLIETLRSVGVSAVLGYHTKKNSHAKITLYFDHFYQKLQQGATLQAAHQDALHCITIKNGIIPPTLSTVIYLSASDTAKVQNIWPLPPKPTRPAPKPAHPPLVATPPSITSTTTSTPPTQNPAAPTLLFDQPDTSGADAAVESTVSISTPPDEADVVSVQTDQLATQLATQLYGNPYPLPSDIALPRMPFKGLSPFRRWDARVFFGRDREIQHFYQLLRDPDAPPVIVIYGAPGVGKTSLLAAGVLPALEASGVQSVLTPCPQTGSLASSLYAQLSDYYQHLALNQSADASLSDTDPVAAWVQKELRDQQPIMLVIDQVEQCFQDVNQRQTLNELLALIQSYQRATHAPLQYPQVQRPQGKLILCVQQHYEQAVRHWVEHTGLTCRSEAVARLDAEGIIQAISGVVDQHALQARYQLEISTPELPREITDRLLSNNPTSPIAPFLQLLLSLLWERAAVSPSPSPSPPPSPSPSYASRPVSNQPMLRSRLFTPQGYNELIDQGILIDQFLDKQSFSLSFLSPQAIESGLLLDLLYEHSDMFNQSRKRTFADLRIHYYQQPHLAELLQQCKAFYLLADAEEGCNDGSQLGHTLLAPTIRQRFAASDRNGQRARRILENHPAVVQASELQNKAHSKTQSRLGYFALQIVEKGVLGMRGWRAIEEKLVKRSRQRFWLLRKRKQILSGIATGGLLLSLWNHPQWVADPLQWLASMIGDSAVNDTTSQEAGIEVPEQNDESSGILDWISSYLPELLGGDTPNKEPGKEPDKEPVADPSTTQSNPATVPNDASYLATAHYQTPITQLAFTPDGARLAVADTSGMVRLWDVATHEEQLALKGHASAVNAILFSPDGTYLFSASANGVIHQWSSTSGELIRSFVGHQEGVNALAFHPQQMIFASAGDDGSIRLWDAVSGQQRSILMGEEGAIKSLVFAATGTQLVSGGTNGNVTIWEVETGQQLASLHGHQAQVNAVDLSPDGHWIVSASDDGTLMLWDAANLQVAEALPVQTLQAHSGAVTSAQFDPTGAYILSAGQDQTMRLWQTQSGELLGNWQGHHERLTSARFRPDGSLIASASWDASVRLWEVTR